MAGGWRENGGGLTRSERMAGADERNLAQHLREPSFENRISEVSVAVGTGACAEERAEERGEERRGERVERRGERREERREERGERRVKRSGEEKEGQRKE
eukprot:3698347-Rhodomonas_salina.1